MAKKIYFSPSDQTRNTYAAGNTNEAAQCRQIALYAVEAAKRCGFEALTDAVSGGDDAMDLRIQLEELLRQVSQVDGVIKAEVLAG